jgi:hypothetical protein
VTNDRSMIKAPERYKLPFQQNLLFKVQDEMGKKMSNKALSRPLAPVLLTKSGSMEPHSQPGKFKVITCSKNCRNNCDSEIKLLNMNSVNKLCEKFKGKNYVETKNNLLMYFKHQISVGLGLDLIHCEGVRLCFGSFSHLTGISLHLLKICKGGAVNDLVRFSHAADCQSEGPQTVKFVAWLLNFTKRFGQSSPDDDVLILPPFLTKSELYKFYVNEVPPPHVKNSTFYLTFKKKFGSRRPDHSLPHIRLLHLVRFLEIVMS